jgi:hypothetical protein
MRPDIAGLFGEIRDRIDEFWLRRVRADVKDKNLAALSGHGDAGGLSYADALHNFYAAARHGLDATIAWPSTGAIAADVLLLELLIPKAREGLADLGIDDSAGSFLDIVEARVRSRQTGASWQRKAFEARGRDMYKLMAAYCERQRSAAPVHQWEL